jgi:hypothetical protein
MLKQISASIKLRRSMISTNSRTTFQVSNVESSTEPLLTISDAISLSNLLGNKVEANPPNN